MQAFSIARDRMLTRIGCRPSSLKHDRHCVQPQFGDIAFFLVSSSLSSSVNHSPVHCHTLVEFYQPRHHQELSALGCGGTESAVELRQFKRQRRECSLLASCVSHITASYQSSPHLAAVVKPSRLFSTHLDACSRAAARAREQEKAMKNSHRVEIRIRTVFDWRQENESEQRHKAKRQRTDQDEARMTTHSLQAGEAHCDCEQS